MIDARPIVYRAVDGGSAWGGRGKGEGVRAIVYPVLIDSDGIIHIGCTGTDRSLSRAQLERGTKDAEISLFPDGRR
jgi:hypothetical protein